MPSDTYMFGPKQYHQLFLFSLNAGGVGGKSFPPLCQIGAFVLKDICWSICKILCLIKHIFITMSKTAEVWFFNLRKSKKKINKNRNIKAGLLSTHLGRELKQTMTTNYSWPWYCSKKPKMKHPQKKMVLCSLHLVCFYFWIMNK